MVHARFASLWISSALVVLASCAPPSGDGDGDGDADTDADTDGDADSDADSDADEDRPFACDPGVWGCHDNVYFECGPDGASRINETPCEEMCDPRRGCVFCAPGARRCEGTVSMVCSASADVWYYGRDCAEWGSTCREETGFCSDACAEAETSDSYVGCEYWPVALANTAELDFTLFDYRVAVANPNDAPATVTITRGGTAVTTETVEAGGLVELALPWINGQSFGVNIDEWQSVATPDGAYRLVSDLPVTVSQFNPFEYESGGVFSYTNDATLLLPTHVLTRDYVGLSYVPLSKREGIVGQPISFDTTKIPGYLAIVGLSPEPTLVQITAAGAVAGGDSVAATPLGGSLSFTVARGEVVHVVAAVPPDCVDGRPGYNRVEDCTGIPPLRICDAMDTCREAEFDLTGSRIHADQPIEVFGGHVCAYVPYTSEACDHLEVQLPPIETWGTEFVSTPMVDLGTSTENLVRVVAAFDGTEVTVDPPQGGVSSVTLGAGEWAEFLASSAFHVRGSEAILVGQFLLGQYAPEPDAARGDPALTVLVPGEQYRPDYTFITPTSYRADINGQNYVMIVRPPGLALTLDGAPVSATWQAVGGREVGIATLGGGTHVIAGADAFGLIAYGLGSFTSYAYPAGLNLEQITPIY